MLYEFTTFAFDYKMIRPEIESVTDVFVAYDLK